MHPNLRTPMVIGLLTISTLVLAGCPAETHTPASAPSKHTGAKDPESKEPGARTTSGPSCNPKVGAKAPLLTIDSMNGAGKGAITPGKVTLVDFWATWCKPCEKSFPKYQDLYTKYKGKGFEVIAIAVDDEKNEIPAFVKKHGAKFPVGWDQGHELAGCWKPASMPTAYIIDKKGVVRHVHNKWEEGSEAKVEEQIKALF